MGDEINHSVRWFYQDLTLARQPLATLAMCGQMNITKISDLIDKTPLEFDYYPTIPISTEVLHKSLFEQHVYVYTWAIDKVSNVYNIEKVSGEGAEWCWEITCSIMLPYAHQTFIEGFTNFTPLIEAQQQYQAAYGNVCKELLKSWSQFKLPLEKGTDKSSTNVNVTRTESWSPKETGLSYWKSFFQKPPVKYQVKIHHDNTFYLHLPFDNESDVFFLENMYEGNFTVNLETKTATKTL